MENCKFCGSKNLRKEGRLMGAQRYKCKDCRRKQVMGDLRRKFTEQERLAAKAMYCEGTGFRAIARILSKIFCKKFVYQTVEFWIKGLGREAEKTLESERKTSEIMPIIEMDELHTYIQKKRIKSECGLLLIETGCVLLRLKSAVEK